MERKTVNTMILHSCRIAARRHIEWAAQAEECINDYSLPRTNAPNECASSMNSSQAEEYIPNYFQIARNI